MNSHLLVVPAVVLLSLGLASCGGDEQTSTPTSTPTSTATSTGVKCDYITDPEAGEPAKEVEPPPAEAVATDTLTIATSAGDIKVSLDSESAPCTVNSFVSLAKQGYFDDTVCHRLTTADSGIFVLQCGDPTGTGTGGPGYRFANETQPDDKFPAGTLAMAHSSLPDSNGSQFFLVYQDTPLPPDYTVFGKTADEASLKVLQDIGAKGTADGAPDGAPKDEVRIESVS